LGFLSKLTARFLKLDQKQFKATIQRFYKKLFINCHSEACTKNEEADCVSLRVKQPKHEADHAPPTGAEVRAVLRRQGVVFISAQRRLHNSYN
jgi:hypothetical protein